MKILVLDLPGLHLGYLGCYGNDWVATPNLDRLASEGVVFDRHVLDIDQPSPLEWTGHHPLPLPQQPAFPRVPTLKELLNAKDHVFVEGASVFSQDTLNDTVKQTQAALHKQRPLTWVRFPALTPPWHLPTELLNSYCDDDEEPWPDPPLGLLKATEDLIPLQNTYAAVITYLDAQVGVLLDEMRAHGKLDEMLVCLTSSFGLPLGEHGFIGAGQPWPHEELVHLPLILRLPDGARQSLRIGALTQPVDLFPTLLEALALQAPPCHGFSLWPLVRGETSQVRPFACSGRTSGTAMEWALRTLDWAFLLPVSIPADASPRAPQLYVKPDDRWEVNDLRQHHPERVEELEKALRAFAAASQHAGAIAYDWQTC